MDSFREDMRAAVLTISDRCAAGTQVDLSGPALVALLTEAGLPVQETAIYPDEVTEIAHALRHYSALADLIVTTGGTGLAPRDVTPEATDMVCDRMIPGLAEQMRASGLAETPFAPLSRAVCGCLGRTLIVNVPGSPSGAVTSLRAILPLLPHALRLLAGQSDHAAALQEDPA
jgi:molybdenum cofactor synthesis domain-containing protein